MGTNTEKAPMNVSDSSKLGTVRPFLLSGFGVAVLSGMAYLMSYLYEAGYAGFFGIPGRMIKLDLISVCFSVGAIFASLSILFFAINLVYMWRPVRLGPLGRCFLRLSSILIVVAICRYFIKDWLLFISPVGTFMIFLIIIEFVFPLFQRGKTYREKLEAQEEVERNVQTIPDLMMRSPGGRTALISILLILYLLLMPGLIGYSQASKRENFLMISGEDDIVVLRIYGDRLICAPLDRVDRTVHRSIIIMVNSPGKPLRLDWEKVGPLKLAPMMDNKQDAISNIEEHF